jgi:hypothetical protein
MIGQLYLLSRPIFVDFGSEKTGPAKLFLERFWAGRVRMS